MADEKQHTVAEMLDVLRGMGYKPRWNPEMKSIEFYYFGHKIIYYVRKKWFQGKGLVAGRGFDKMVSQLIPYEVTIIKNKKVRKEI